MGCARSIPRHPYIIREAHQSGFVRLSTFQVDVLTSFGRDPFLEPLLVFLSHCVIHCSALSIPLDPLTSARKCDLTCYCSVVLTGQLQGYNHMHCSGQWFFVYSTVLVQLIDYVSPKQQTELLISELIIVVITTWPSEKPSQKVTLTSQLSVFPIGSNGLIYSKSRAWCHSFQPIN